MGKRFGYMVPKTDGTYDVVVVDRVADETVLEEFERVTAVFLDLQPVAIALAVAESAFHRLTHLGDQESARLRELGSTHVPISVLMEFMVEATRILNAFLASASALLGQATKYVSRVHGEQPKPGGRWHTLRRDCHARSLGYRIMYELRNFSQHHSLPLSRIRIDGEVDADDEFMFTTGAHVLRDELLASDYDWKARRADLEALDASFDVVPLAEEYLDCLRELTTAIASYRRAELLECRRYLKMLRRVLKVPKSARLYLFHEDRAEGGVPTGGTIVPDEQFAWVLRTLVRNGTDGA